MPSTTANPSVLDLAGMIDHSLLHPTMTDEQLRTGLAIARRCSCATACVKPYAVPMSVGALAGSGVATCAVAGFPHGNSHIALKVAEAARAITEGATEIDAVVNIGKVLGGDWAYVSEELKVLAATCASRGAILKVIFENDYLPDESIIRLCELCTSHGIAFVKTSSGYGFVKQPQGDYNYRGATEHDVKLMKSHAGPTMLVKAAGGVRNYADTVKMCELGCSRIGASATEAIVAGEKGAPSAEVLKAGTQGY
jgi:deoxyribose-phosphate aldolase